MGYTKETIKRFPAEAYKGEMNLLEAERALILTALWRTWGNVMAAWKLLCPNEIPYTYNACLKVMYRHGIDPQDFKTKESRSQISKIIKIKK